jgi:hypothetical protein
LKVTCLKNLKASSFASRAYAVFLRVNRDAFFSYEHSQFYHPVFPSRVAFSQQDVFVVQSPARKSFHRSAARLKARNKKPDV